MKWFTNAGRRPAGGVRERGAEAVREHLQQEIANSAAGTVRAARRAVRAYVSAVAALAVSALVIIVFAMSSAASEVARFALDTNRYAEFAAYALDPVVGGALFVFMALEALIAASGQRPADVFWYSRWFCGLVTLVMNVCPSLVDHAWASALLHSVMPGLLLLVAELLPTALRQMGKAIRAMQDSKVIALRAELDRVDTEIQRTRDEAARLEAEQTARAEQARRDARWAREDDDERQRRASERRVQVERELSEIRIAEAAAVAAARAAAETPAPPAARPAARRPVAKKSRPGQRPQTKPATLTRAEAASKVKALLAAHDPETDTFTTEMKALAAEHGGGRTFWFHARTDAETGIKAAS